MQMMGLIGCQPMQPIRALHFFRKKCNAPHSTSEHEQNFVATQHDEWILAVSNPFTKQMLESQRNKYLLNKFFLKKMQLPLTKT